MKCPDGHVDDLLSSETLDHSGFPHVLVRAVTQAEVITLAPSPNQSVPRQRQRELGSAFDLTYPNTVELLHILQIGISLCIVQYGSPNFLRSIFKLHPGF